MIFETLELLRAELDAYFKAPERDADTQVVLKSAASGKAEQVLLSVVNVEEEAALKNSSPYQRNALGGFDLVNPPVYLNLYVLVAACSTDNSTYDTALKRLAWVIQCFQQMSSLSASGSMADQLGNDAGIDQLRVSINMHPLSFERANQIWGTLCGRQAPSVLYKVRVVAERGAAKVSQVPEIERIQQFYPTSLQADQRSDLQREPVSWEEPVGFAISGVRQEILTKTSTAYSWSAGARSRQKIGNNTQSDLIGGFSWTIPLTWQEHLMLGAVEDSSDSTAVGSNGSFVPIDNALYVDASGHYLWVYERGISVWWGSNSAPPAFWAPGNQIELQIWRAGSGYAIRYFANGVLWYTATRATMSFPVRVQLSTYGPAGLAITNVTIYGADLIA